MTADRPSDAYAVIPKLGELRDNVLFGDVWERPDLSKRDRSMITVAMLTVLYRTEELRGHIARALDNGLTPDEVREVILHATFYGGWPTGVNGARVAGDVFKARNI